MKVSIITSCYNRRSTIGQTIESVLAQDYPDIEHIIIDGASTDGSVDVIDRYRDRKMVDKVVSEPDSGMYEAINKGIRLATGDVVGLLHSDDFFFDSHVVADIAALFRATGADVVYGNGLYVDASDTSRVVRNWVSCPSTPPFTYAATCCSDWASTTRATAWPPTPTSSCAASTKTGSTWNTSTATS